MEHLIQDVEAVFQEIDLKTSELQIRTGLRCRAGCGDCCNSPEVEAMVLEMLPLAAELLKTGEADSWYDAATSKSGAACVFYQASPDDRSLGRCLQYSKRPSICRLFGFTARLNKDGKVKELITCRWQKALQEDLVQLTKKQIAEGTIEAPIFSTYYMKLKALDPSSHLSDRMPINLALTKAIEILSLRQQYWSDTLPREDVAAQS